MNSNHQRVLSELREIFAKNTDKRICVIAASCTGKTTLLQDLPECYEIDKEVWANLPKDVQKQLGHLGKPWTLDEIEIFKGYCKAHEISIKPGRPLFSIYYHDCDLLVYLHLDEGEYISRVKKRSGDLESQLKHRGKTIQRVKDATVPVIIVDLSLPKQKRI